MLKSYAIVGGAGFIGSHFVTHLLQGKNRVTVIDNFCSGTMKHLEKHLEDPNFVLEKYDVIDTSRLSKSFIGIDTVIHLASNPDIARASTYPRVDFEQGTVLTESVAEASRLSGVKQILYASGSGVYGDAGDKLLNEDSPIRPISTYGASKFAGETLLSAYSFMFGITAFVFRFANVVGPMQTHGVTYDFLRKLSVDSETLTILGDGKQSKSYIHVSDVIDAVLKVGMNCKEQFSAFNVSTDQLISVNEIAELSVAAMGLSRKAVVFNYSGGDRGWKADVPLVRLDSQKIRETGWTPRYTSKEAILQSIESMAQQIRTNNT